MGRGKTGRRYTREFKSQAVELSRQPGMSVPKVAADLGIPVNALYRWKNESKEQGADAFRGHGVRPASAIIGLTFPPNIIEGNSNSYRTALAANGSSMAFSSNASNLVAGDANGQRDVFTFDQGCLLVTTHPASQAVCVGQTVTMSVAAVGYCIHLPF